MVVWQIFVLMPNLISVSEIQDRTEKEQTICGINLQGYTHVFIESIGACHTTRVSHMWHIL